MSDVATRTTRIRVEIPCRPDQIRVLRLTASSVASDSGLTATQIQDLALAIDELATAVIDASDPQSRLLVTVTGDDLGISLRGRVIDSPPSEVVVSDIAQSMLEQACDSWSVSDPGAAASFRLTALVGDVV